MSGLTTPKIDADDPGKAAIVAAAAAILYARCSGFNAENQLRAHREDCPPMYTSVDFDYEVDEFFKRLEQ